LNNELESTVTDPLTNVAPTLTGFMPQARVARMQNETKAF
jgi:hypothetical protein